MFLGIVTWFTSGCNRGDQHISPVIVLKVVDTLAFNGFLQDLRLTAAELLPHLHQPRGEDWRAVFSGISVHVALKAPVTKNTLSLNDRQNHLGIYLIERVARRQSVIRTRDGCQLNLWGHFSNLWLYLVYNCVALEVLLLRWLSNVKSIYSDSFDSLFKQAARAMWNTCWWHPTPRWSRRIWSWTCLFPGCRPSLSTGRPEECNKKRRVIRVWIINDGKS